MIIKTNRLLIRKFKQEDWKAVYDYTANPIVMKYIPEGIFTKVGAKEFVNKNSGIKAENFAVTLIDENILIGHVIFHKYFGEHTYEIGWVFNPQYQNRGYASEAAQAVLDFGFKQMDLHRVIATCQPENVPSFRVMEKIGMRREGLFKKCIPNGKEWWDEFFYAVLKEEWI